MRSRSFSTSLPKPPFVLNYSGILFRVYPEKYQSILNIGAGKNKVVKFFEQRPTSAEFRDALVDALSVPGVSKNDLKPRGLELWWENTNKEVSTNWRN